MVTRDYLSPELVEESMSGPYSDLWALCIIVFKLLTGKKPFSRNNEKEILDYIVKV